MSLVATAFAVAATLGGPASAANAQSSTDTVTMFGSSQPRTAAAQDSRSVNLGVKFKSSRDGFITGLRFYKSSANTGTHYGALWTAGASKLAGLTFENETSSGWQSARFATPVKITAGTTYVASYLAPRGSYFSDAGYFSAPKVSGPLTATGSGYLYQSTMAFPWDSWNTNYYVDVMYSEATTQPAPSPSPTPTPSPAPSQPAPEGSLLWKADAEQNLWDEWASISTQTNCAVTTTVGMADSRVSRVTTPRIQGAYAWRTHIEAGDTCYDERTELGQGGPDKTGFSNRQFKAGDEAWISFAANPSAGVVNAQYWQTNMQFKQLNSGGGAFYLGILNGRWQLLVSDTNQVAAGNNYQEFWGAPARAGAWTKLTFHIRFSSDPNIGFIEVYGDPDGNGVRQLMAKRQTWTMKVNTNVSYLRTGIYRDARNNTAADLYIDGLTVASTRARAEYNAFG